MLKQWALPVMSALALSFMLGGSAPVGAVADPFPVQSGYTDCPASVVITPDGSAPPALGEAAIQPHLHSIPAFTANDVRQYLKKNGFPGAFGSFTILKILFISSGEVCARTRGESTGLDAGTLVCFVEAQGTFYPRSWIGPGPAPSSPYNYEVFDAQTGNLLLFGG